MPKYINLDKLYEEGYTHLKGHVCKDGHCGVVLTPLDEIETVEIEEDKDNETD